MFASQIPALVLLVLAAPRLSLAVDDSNPKWYENEAPACTAYLSAGIEGAQNNILPFAQGQQSKLSAAGKQYVTINPNDYDQMVTTGRRQEVAKIKLTPANASVLSNAYGDAGAVWGGHTRPRAIDALATWRVS